MYWRGEGKYLRGRRLRCPANLVEGLVLKLKEERREQLRKDQSIVCVKKNEGLDGKSGNG